MLINGLKQDVKLCEIRKREKTLYKPIVLLCSFCSSFACPYQNIWLDTSKQAICDTKLEELFKIGTLERLRLYSYRKTNKKTHIKVVYLVTEKKSTCYSRNIFHKMLLTYRTYCCMASVKLKDIGCSWFHDFKIENNAQKPFKCSKAQKVSLH